MVRKITPQGLDLLRRFEGGRAAAYRYDGEAERHLVFLGLSAAAQARVQAAIPREHVVDAIDTAKTWNSAPEYVEAMRLGRNVRVWHSAWVIASRPSVPVSPYRRHVVSIAQSVPVNETRS